MKRLLLVTVLLLASVSSYGQQSYSGMQTRLIKALSDEQIAELKAGRGMGFALAAELNGYPGPAHVLELSDQLGLSAEQHGHVQQLFESMRREALPLGARLVEQEAQLDRQFADRSITPETLRSATASIAVTQGQLRESHLKYHLVTAALLSPEQIQRYRELRGYGSGETEQRHHGRAH
jgi:hypothetical protein